MERSLTNDFQRRQVSGREIELMMMRKRLRDVRQQAYVREMEAREMQRINLLASYSYHGDDDLYHDCIQNLKEEDKEHARKI